MSADRSPATVRETDNPPPTSSPQQDKPAPQAQDFRADRERNDAMVRRPPMQRVPDADGVSPRPGGDRSREPRSGAVPQDKGAPSRYHSDLEHNRAVMQRPPMQRPDNAGGSTQRPDAAGTSRDTPSASSARQHPGSDAAGPGANRNAERTGTGPDSKPEGEDRPAASDSTALGKTENAERTESASTDNANSSGQRTAEGPRSTSENISDVPSGPTAQRHHDDVSRSPGQTADEKRVGAIGQPTAALNPVHPGEDGQLSADAPSQATEQAGSRPQQEHARAKDPGDSREFPTDADREQGRAIYAEWRQSIGDGRNQGANVVGEEPSESPGKLIEGRDPPTGKQLLEMEDSKRSRFDTFRHELEGEESLDSLHDEVEQDGHTLQGILEHPPVATHAEQRMPDTPHYMPVSAAGIDGGSVAGSALLLGVFAVEMGRRIHAVFDHKKGVG